MNWKVVIVIAAVALVAVSAAGAVADGTVIRVQSGERVVVNNNLSCFVETNGIVCGGAYSSHLSADIRSNGEIVVQFDPTPHGAAPALFVERAVCAPPTGACRLITKHP